MAGVDISIVVPLHNEEQYLDTCLKSLLAQEYPHDRYEVIVVDNNSTDRSVEIANQYSRVTLLSETRQGDFAARNRGVQSATGDIIAFTDSDSAPASDWLQRISERMRPEHLRIVVGKLQFRGESAMLRMLEDYEDQKAEFIFSRQTSETYLGCTCNMAVRRAVFQEVGPFPEVFRNSDVVLVHKVVERSSCDTVCYGPQMRVTRLEVSSVSEYFHKLSTYGRDYRRYAELVSARPLTTNERLRVFAQLVKRRRYSYTRAAVLLGLLSVGAVYYEVPRWASFPRPRHILSRGGD